MASNFCTVNHLGYSLFVYRPWWDAGIRHGMTTIPLDFSDNALPIASRGLGEALSIDSLILPRQTHGSSIINMLNRSDWNPDEHGGILRRCGDGDAVIASASTNVDRGGRRGLSRAIGVRTADCVPIIVEGVGVGDSSRMWAVIHAGWRGLACGIIAETFKELSLKARPITAVVFPCGGTERYEVGKEVIDAIGATAVFSPRTTGPSTDEQGKFFLNLALTAAQQIAEATDGAAIAVAHECTMAAKYRVGLDRELPLFHSHRRDGAKAGRNLTFVRL